MSIKNPFRHPASLSNPSTSTEVVAAPPESPPLPPLPLERTPSPVLHSATGGPSTHADASDLPPPIDDDLPPPYTPAANLGEETIGLGPRRPFQQAPSHPSSHAYSSSPPQHLQPTPTGPNSIYYAQPQSSWQGRTPAPWQTQQQYRQRQNGGGLIGALVDTVRDIADVVSGAHDERMMGLRRANAGAYANGGTAYTTPPGHQVYHPPPFPPPAGSSPPAPPPGPSFGPPPRPSSTPPSIPDDGTPTHTPVPGHPLLKAGHLLVYPKDFLCVKCKNTGYKNYDPSNPCRKCWEKYGKPYTGALSYTPWKSSGNDPRMQRALPRFVPPHLAGSSPSSAYAPPTSGPLPPPSHHHPPPPQHPHHSRSISQPHRSASGPSYYVLNPLGSYDSRPPVPDAIPVSPGDPRLGGHLCWRCGGEGVRPSIFDMGMCDHCGGTGRLWR